MRVMILCIGKELSQACLDFSVGMVSSVVITSCRKIFRVCDGSACKDLVNSDLDEYGDTINFEASHYRSESYSSSK